MSAATRRHDAATPRAAAAIGLQNELAQLHEDRAHLKGEVARLERHVSALALEVAAADEKVGDLQKLLLAARRLDACSDRPAVLEALRDIVVTVLGAEDFVILGLDDDRTTLWPILGSGPSGSACGPLLVSDSLVADAMGSGTRVVAPAHGEPGAPRREAVACVPLHSGTDTIGMLVLFSLLAHRSELRGVDLELLDFLSGHAATMLQIADLRSNASGRSLSLL